MTNKKDWMFGPFKKDAEPILKASANYSFLCPVLEKECFYEATNVYNPSVIVKDNELHMIYRADDVADNEKDPWGNAKVTCRLAYAKSSDGINFERLGTPVLYPDNDEFKEFEWWGGCQDLHIIEDENGKYYMNYDGWTGKYNMETHGFGNAPKEPWEDVLMSAVSDDLVHWKKCGPSLNEKWKKYWNHSRSGVVICREENGKLIATKINGKYYMYMGHQGTIAYSDDLVKWDLLLDENENPIHLFPEDTGKTEFDSKSHEAGAAAILTEYGIVYFYNGLGDVGDENGLCWSQGQALIDKNDLTTVIDKTETPVFSPEFDWEKKGHSGVPCVVCNSIVLWDGKRIMYYGGCDTVIGRAVEDISKKTEA